MCQDGTRQQDSVRLRKLFWVPKPLARAATAFCMTVAMSTTGGAHPHVFVDGGVDFVFADDTVLEALNVTWLYDEFETLYLLASYEMSLQPDGTLAEEDRLELVRRRSLWPSDFDGSAHLSIDGRAVALDWPTDLDAGLIDGRLQITFTRALTEPVKLQGKTTDVAFYESTYFFAFSITNAPQLIGETAGCDTSVAYFDPDSADKTLLATLAKLSREETPNKDNVGALFADRILVECA